MPAASRDIQDRSVRGVCHIVDEDVAPAAPFQRFGNDFVYLLRYGQIGLYAEGLNPIRGQFLHHVIESSRRELTWILPARPSTSAVALPIPLVAPVTTATAPWSEKSVDSDSDISLI